METGATPVLRSIARRQPAFQLHASVVSTVFFCGSTGFGWRSMYVFMVFAFHFRVVRGVSPTTCGSAPLSRRNPRLLWSADTAFTFITSHTV
jgi:hypothetical protein